jgi:hypothetical protein
MATAYKDAEVQGDAGVTTYVTLYNTGAASTAVISTIGICNTSSSAATYRIAVMGSAGTPAAANWRVYDASIAGNDTVTLTLGLTLGNTRYIRCSSSANTVTFFAGVSEIT